ncbi:hypothetical protein MC28_C021 (plasmid) [Bacillus thuringiensis MC28]|nr:hypothetical protein MC28_C021 [Bacillus thuringiensis MC28]
MWRRKMKKLAILCTVSLILLSGLSISEKNKVQNPNNVQYMVDPGGMG